MTQTEIDRIRHRLRQLTPAERLRVYRAIVAALREIDAENEQKGLQALADWHAKAAVTR